MEFADVVAGEKEEEEEADGPFCGTHGKLKWVHLCVCEKNMEREGDVSDAKRGSRARLHGAVGHLLSLLLGEYYGLPGAGGLLLITTHLETTTPLTGQVAVREASVQIAQGGLG